MAKVQVPDDFREQNPDGDVLATEAAMNTIRTADLLFDRIGRLLRPLNVSQAGGLVLGILRDHGPLSPSELGDRMIVTRATVTGVLDSLEKRGLVRRSANPVDRRGVVVQVTLEGRAVLQLLRRRIHREERAWFGVLSAPELQAYIAVLQRLQDSLEAQPTEPD